MNIGEYVFDHSLLQEPIDAFIAQFQSMVDLNNTKLFTTVRRDAVVWREPNDSELPEMRIVANTVKFASESTPATFPTGDMLLSLYIYWRDDSTDWQLNGLNFLHYVLKRLQGPDSGVTDATGIEASNNWWIDYQGATVTIAITDLFEKYGTRMQLAPPYRGARIDIPVEVCNLQV